jgi:hypothetical protein
MSSAQLSPGGRTTSIGKILDRPVITVKDLPLKGPEAWNSPRPLSAEPSILEVRELTEVEAAAVRPKSYAQAPIAELGVIRARHHEVARLLAAGAKRSEVAQVMRMSEATIGLLQRSPAFQQLLMHYMRVRDDQALGISAKLKETALDVLLIIGNRLAAEGEVLPIDTLRKLGTDMLDRAGFSPVQKNLNVNMGLSPDEIRSIREQHALAPDAGKTLSATAVDVSADRGANGQGLADKGNEGGGPRV